MSSPASAVNLPVASENQTYVCFQTGQTTPKTANEAAQPIVSVVTEEAFNKAVAAGEVKPEAEITRGTFAMYRATTIEGAHEIYGEDLINMVNRGGATKQQNKIRALLTEVNDEGEFVFAQGESEVHDLKPYLSQPTAKRGLSETEKGLNFIKKLSPEAQAQILKAMGAPQEAIDAVLAGASA